MKRSQAPPRGSIFWNLLMICLIPALCASMLLLLITVPIISHITAEIDRKTMEGLVFNAGSILDDIETKSKFAAESIGKSEYFYNIYVDHCLTELPLTAIQRSEATGALAGQAIQVPYARQISLRYYKAPETLLCSSGSYENISYFQQNFPEKPEYAFFDAGTGFSTVTLGGEKTLLYSCSISDASGGSRKAQINILFDSARLWKKLQESTGSGILGFELLGENGERLWAAGAVPEVSEVSEAPEALEGPGVTKAPGAAEKAAEAVSETAAASETAAEARAKTAAAAAVAGPAAASGTAVTSGSGRYRIYVTEEICHATRNQSIPLLILAIVLNLVIVGAAALYYSHKNYTPLKNTVEKYTGDAKGRDDTGNELEAIDRFMQMTLLEKETASASLGFLSPIAGRRLLELLITEGKAAANVDDAVWKQCGLEFPYPDFTVCLIRFQNPLNPVSREGTVSSPGIITFLEQCIRRVEKEEGCRAYVCKAGRDRFAVLINGDRQQQRFITELRSALAGAEEKISDLSYFGLGTTVHGFSELPRSFEHAEAALEYAVSRGSDEIISYVQIKDRKAAVHRYSRSDELLLLSAIRDCDYDKAMTVVDRIYDSNRELTGQNSTLLFLSVKATILNAAAEEEADLSDFEALKQESTAMEYRLQLEKMLLALCERIEEGNARILKKKSGEIISYIDSSLCDPCLSLSEVAGAFDCTPANISETVRRLTGEKYTDYVNRKRIRKAIALMYSEGLDMNKVYPMVGYVSITTFRRNYHRFAEAGKQEERKNSK